jgi:hypothetical protein
LATSCRTGLGEQWNSQPTKNPKLVGCSILLKVLKQKPLRLSKNQFIVYSLGW